MPRAIIIQGGVSLKNTLPEKRLCNYVLMMMERNLEKSLKATRLFYLQKAGFDPNQPRIPAGSGSSSGQWSGDAAYTLSATRDEDTTPRSQQHSNTTPPAPKQPSVDKALRHLRQNALPKSISKCATYVRQALNAGGFDVKPILNAREYGNNLIKAGFKPVAIYRGMGVQTLLRNDYLPDYIPEAGDVAVIQPHAGGNPAGHMTMYDGTQWFSDFKQIGIYPGVHYRQKNPPYVIYRYAN